MKGVSLKIVSTCRDHVLESLFGFFRCDTWLQIFQNDSKICEPEVTLTSTHQENLQTLNIDFVAL